MFDAARIGSVIQFRYPRHNFHGVPCRYEVRRLRVDAVRDVTAEPVEAEHLVGNPLLKRSRYLVTGWDLDKGAERSFYDGSMEDVESLAVDQLTVDTSPLPVAITRDGELRRIVLMDDPRAGFCRGFNDISQSTAVPYPISAATCFASSVRREV